MIYVRMPVLVTACLASGEGLDCGAMSVVAM